MASERLISKYNHIAAIIQITENVSEIVLYGGRAHSGGPPVSETTIIRIGKLHTNNQV